MQKSVELQPGQRFGRLTVVSLHHIRKHINKNSNRITNKEYYLCKCDCGKEKIIYKYCLGRSTKSCGCLDLEKKTKHGLYGTRIYREWQRIKRRCYYKKDDSYSYYGGRGIAVCDEWKNDFMAFYNWAMANGYRDVLTIDRINNDWNYEPSNCRFITNKEQQRNKRNNHFIEYKGKKLCLSEWAELFNIDVRKLGNRIRRGWNIKRALNDYRGA